MLRDEHGQAMAEYTIILALVALAAIGGLLTLGPKVAALYNAVANGF